ncbi:hypothetical protein J3R82DRAFT_3297 [Butyriboletus roseoflavus]|nr:hypothetical protein J3R82DRAFT_3297 [Butyriboletus roseoflavus]
MPKKPKAGPPYTDIPEEIYVVVTNPWGMNANPRSRNPGDFNRIASWAQLILQQAGLGGGRVATIECIYSMGTRNEIILQFQEGTDIIPLLGEHRWANFAKGWNPNDPRSTRVFIYNWRNNGDPANHNWTENFPNPLPLDTVPVKSPYPAPSWTQPPSTLANFVLPIPHPPILPPVPNHEHNPGQEQQSAILPPPSVVTPSPAPPEQPDQPDFGEQAVAQDSVSTNLFKPYEPPSQHASLARFLDRQQARCDEALSSQASPPPPKFIKKLDPYELEEDALSALRSLDPSQEDMKDARNEDVKLTLPLSVKLEHPEVKTEDSDAQNTITSESGSRYQPSQALVDAFNSLTQPEQKPPSARPLPRDPRRRPSATSQIATPASSGYQPSAALEAEINSFLMGATASSSSSVNGTRPRASRVNGIKREYEEDVATSLGEGKRIKIEEC